MKYGLALPYNNGKRVMKYARLVEEAGWDGLFLGDAIWCEDPMIALTAAAAVTERIRLGTMIIPVPLRRPWKLASESVALDRLSNGRLILGLGTGAVWMGWQGFPDEVIENKARAKMLDETIDILTLFYKCRQFDYDGEYYNLKLSELDEMYYPPKPVQRPRIPIWIPGIWPRKKSMQRTLKCDGLLAEVISPDGKPEPVTPEDLRNMKAFVQENRTLNSPFDIVVNGNTIDLAEAERQEVLESWEEAGATWWVEGLWEAVEEDVEIAIREGLEGIR